MKILWFFSGLITVILWVWIFSALVLGIANHYQTSMDSINRAIEEATELQNAKDNTQRMIADSVVQPGRGK